MINAFIRALALLLTCYGFIYSNFQILNVVVFFETVLVVISLITILQFHALKKVVCDKAKETGKTKDYYIAGRVLLVFNIVVFVYYGYIFISIVLLIQFFQGLFIQGIREEALELLEGAK